MRMPLILLIVVFAVSVLGLSLIPGEDAEGRPVRMSIFDSFYFMSYTATTIGFGEIPYPLTHPQRLWVTFSIFLSVIGWAYAIGTLLALLQDRGFRRALAWQHFMRKVAHLNEPFLLIVGYGGAGQMLGRSLDAMGRRFVVVDAADQRIAALDLESLRADAPGIVGDARDAGRLTVAGLGHRWCEGVLALTGDDETNLGVAMSVALLRPDLAVIARANSRQVTERMRALGTTEVVNPFDRFGDHLRILLRSPASYQLMAWLTSAPGTELPPRRKPIPAGRWVVCGYGRFGREITADLRAEGLEVTVIEPRATGEQDPAIVVANTVDHTTVEHAVGFVAGTDSDATNLSLIAAARRDKPSLFIVARQNRAANTPLFEAIGVDFVMLSAQVIAHETLARLANPVLIRFLERVPRQGEAWAERLVERLTGRCGVALPDLWQVRLNPEGPPTLTAWLATGQARLGDLMRSSQGRDNPIEAVPLLVLRGTERVLAPDDDFVLAPDDELLMAGRSIARRTLEATLIDPATMEYVINGRFVASSWVWRQLAGRR
jgi:Trk K+ transport system NAD-binding subunit